jgi:hypothetical protein
MVYGAPASTTGLRATPAELPLDADEQVKDVFQRLTP